MSKFRIDKIEIDGFRGYSKLQEINLSRESALITGGNFCGKSSTLGAIEWCLFGDFISVPKNASLYRKRDEFVNDRKSATTVSLFLYHDGSKIKVTRSKKRNVLKTDLVVCDNENNEFIDEDGEKELFRIIGLNLDDFVRSIYLHQESIRFLLTEDPQDRNTALDRLLGLETLTRILDGVPKNKITKKINSFSERIEEIKNNIEARLRENAVSIKDAKDNCIESGMKAENLKIEYATSLIHEINKSLSSIIKGSEININKTIGIKSSTDLKQAIVQLKESLATIRSKLFDNESIEDLRREKRDLQTLLDDYSEIHIDFTRDKKELITFIEGNGNKEKIQKNIDTVTLKIKELDDKRNELGSKQKLFQDAMKYFTDFSVEECPICNSKIQQKSLLKELKTKAEKYVTDELKTIDIKISEQKKIKSDYEQLGTQFSKLDDNYQTSNKELMDCFKSISMKIGMKVDLSTKIKETITKKIEGIDKEIEKLTSPLKEKDAKLKENEDKVQHLELLDIYFKKKERQKLLEGLQKNKELQDAEKIIINLAEYQQMLNVITRCIQEVQVESAEGMIGKVSNRINEIYNSIVNHPYFSELCIDVKPSLRRTGPKNNYFIKGVNKKEGAETLVAERFSTGHMNCVALSIYLALAESGSLNHKLNFLVLDDPSQNLDKIHMEGLANILSTISQKTQIILSTQDPAFTPIIKEKFGDDSTIHLNLVSWDQNNGPVIECEK